MDRAAPDGRPPANLAVQMVVVLFTCPVAPVGAILVTSVLGFLVGLLPLSSDQELLATNILFHVGVALAAALWVTLGFLVSRPEWRRLGLFVGYAEGLVIAAALALYSAESSSLWPAFGLAAGVGFLALLWLLRHLPKPSPSS
ncbi:MAG: hypothetical protein ACYTF3_05385 [Planctomycetota bacterium]